MTQRTHEIGICMALGAAPTAVLRSVLRQGGLLTMTGLAIGVPSAIVLSRLIASWLYGVTSVDLLTYLAVAGALSSAALLACYIPARRATKIDPMVALRYE